MATTFVQHLLRKINYIEAEVEIQKQILFSIPAEDTEEIERIVAKIAQAKEEIDSLRAQIKDVSPEEHRKILTIEKAVSQFKSLANTTTFTSVESMTNDQHCSIQLLAGDNVSCLVKARDEQGNWTIITTEGEIQKFTKDEIKQDF